MSQISRVPLATVAGTIDFGIITFREDEFLAVLRQFKPTMLAIGENHYNIADLKSAVGPVRVAIIRTSDQGDKHSQWSASKLLSELDASCLVVVGIAGAKPESEFTLGDVVVATRLHDFSQSAALAGGRTETTNLGGSMHAVVRAAAANLLAIEHLLGDWNSEGAIGRPKPPIDLRDF